MLNNIYDKEDMKSVLDGLPLQIEQAYAIATPIKVEGNADHLILCGMGGSSISNMILSTYVALNIPILVTQHYKLPTCATKHSIIIITSYSGNTEESLSCYRQARQKGLRVIVIASGGKLIEYCIKDAMPYIQIPKGLQPRNAIAYLFFPIIKILEQSGIIPSCVQEVQKTVTVLKKNKEQYEKIAKHIASELMDKLPVIYASEENYSIAYRWKCELNENAKIAAFANKFPELNHNEFNGYVNYTNQHIPMHVIMLKDDEDHKRISKRMDLTKKYIKQMTEQKITVTEVQLKGDCRLAKIFTAIYLGDLVSYYTALSYGTDPTPVEIIESFKKDMGPFTI